MKQNSRNADGSERAGMSRNALLRVTAALMCLVMLCTLTSSAFYFNRYLADTATERAMPTVTRSLSNNMQKLSYAPAVSYALKLVYSSAELDLSVTILDEFDQIVTGYPFEIAVTPSNPESETVTAVDDNTDGVIEIDEIAEGDYTVTVTKADGYILPDPLPVTVEPQVTYEKIDVSDKINSMDDVDVSEEDGQYNKPDGGGADSGNNSSPQPSGNTVEFVPSSSKTETKTTTVDKLVNGVQVYWYKPVLSGDFLVWADGSVSDLIAVLDANGYLVEAKRAVETETPVPETPPVETPPADTTNTEGVGDTTYEKVTLIDANYNLIADAKTGKTVQAEKIKATETKTEQVTTYYGWQTIDGKRFYYDKNGHVVTGWQVIQGISYFFTPTGVQGGSTGIDVSTYQGNINWAKVKASGVDFVFIRLGFRGWGTGRLVVDDMFYTNMAGATAAGLKVGVYFFTQAINEREAVEEASMCLQLVSGYNISYPIAIDIEDAGSSSARTNGLSASTRTKICKAFCQTIESSGYRAAVYANKYWLTNLLYTSELENYVIWLAHYVEQTSYARRYDIWQYSSTGRVDGISGNVDMNISYF